MTVKDYAAVARAYARDVVAGRVLACRWVRLACQRHLDDLKRARTKEYPYRFDAARANAACRFAELMPHVKGHWAIPVPGKPEAVRIRLEPFQVFERASLFGWVEKASGFRRFRIAYIERPRKNAKSTDAAITGLYCLAADREYGAEVYSGATSEKQAWEVFRPAKQMAERTPEYRTYYGVEVNAKSLAVLETGSRFEPIIGKPGDGASPSLSITDEYHEHPDSVQFDTMVTGMGARRQPLALVITTAGDDMESPCYALHERVVKMLDGTMPDDRLFGIIYTIDDGEDWTSETALRKANPNYGVSVDATYLQAQQRTALNDSRLQNVFKTKHLNVWNTSRSPWMNMEWWHRQADSSLAMETFREDPCWMGFDVAARIDIVAAVTMFRRELEDVPHFYCFGRYYVPEARVNEPEMKHYQRWAHDGYLIPTDGNDIDLAQIMADVQSDKTVHGYDVRGAGIDPWNSISLRDGLGRLGITAIEIPQQVGYFSEPMKFLEAAVKDGRLHHDGNPCMTWMMGNVTVRPDAKDNVFPRKDRRENKIDGPVALIMAMRLAMEQKVSVYESRGLEVL